MSRKKGLGKVAIYYRVSTDKQDLDSQRGAVEKWIADLKSDQKPDFIAVYQDEGISGTTLRRPGFQNLMKDCYEQKYDTLIVYRLDRFSRNATTAINQILSLDELGVAFISVTQPVLNLGHENPFRRTMLAAFAEIAEIERETIVTRVKAGLDAARKRGVRLGAPKTTDTPENLAKVEELRAAGHSYRKIAKELGIALGSVHAMLKVENRE